MLVANKGSAANERGSVGARIRHTLPSRVTLRAEGIHRHSLGAPPGPCSTNVVYIKQKSTCGQPGREAPVLHPRRPLCTGSICECE